MFILEQDFYSGGLLRLRKGELVFPCVLSDVDASTHLTKATKVDHVSVTKELGKYPFFTIPLSYLRYTNETDFVADDRRRIDVDGVLADSGD